MSKFEKRMESRVRINELTLRLINLVDDFSEENNGLTENEIRMCLLNFLNNSINIDLKQE